MSLLLFLEVMSDEFVVYHVTHSYPKFMTSSPIQWSFLLPLIGGRYHIIRQLAAYTTYIPLIYCLLGDYISPTTY